MFLLSAAFCARIGAETALPRAILDRGTVVSQGVPGFGPNRLPCLTGRYAFGELGPVSVYALSEPVLFDPARWAKSGTASNTRWIGLADGLRVVAASRSVPVTDAATIPGNWHFVAAFPETLSEADCLAFMSVFVERTAFFFSTAKSRETLSFPAVLDMPAR